MRLSLEWHPGHCLLGLLWGRESFPDWPGTRNLRLFFGPLALRLSWPLPLPEPPPDIEGWICGCGNIQDDEFHCDTCGAEPPWGCPCDMHDDLETEEAEEDDEYGTYP